MKQVQFPRNTTAVEDGVIGPQGQVRMDTTRNELRLHDGTTPGGHRIPNYDLVQQLIANGGDAGGNATANVTIYATQADMEAATPPTSSLLQLALVVEAGLESMYYWKLTGSDDGTVDSDVSGTWHRFDSQSDTVIRLWRAGLLPVNFGAVAPTEDQGITPWMHNGVLKFWDGTEYANATPALYGLFLAAFGGYYVGTISQPDRLADILVAVDDLNAVTGSGWWSTKTTTANAPLAQILPVYHQQVDAHTAVQTIGPIAGSGDVWIRAMATDVWGSWVQYSPSTYLPKYRQDSSGALIVRDTAAFFSNNSSVTGAIQIHLKGGWLADMMRFKVSVYDFNDATSFDAFIAGYTYTTSLKWVDSSVCILGQPDTQLNLQVRFGHAADGNPAIWIGETTTVWHYPVIGIYDLLLGYGHHLTQADPSNWDISIVNAFGTVDQTQSATQVGRPATVSSAAPSGGVDGDLWYQV